MKFSGVWVVIPAYNERTMIEGVLQALAASPYRVVVVDDGSHDQTEKVILRYPITLLQHVTNLGQGAALQTGISYAREQAGCQVIVTFDADGQHSPEDIEKLIQPIVDGEVDVVLGSRFIRGGEALQIPRVRRHMLRLATWFTGLMTGLKTTDTHNGLRAFSLHAARRINLVQNRMAHASEILSLIRQEKFRYREVPVTVHYTEYSLSKGQSILNLVNILWETFSGRLK